jgi:hypothetical protein
MNKTTLLLLSVAISAFIMGGTTLLFLDKRYVRADGGPPSISAGSGFVRNDDVQICWGELNVMSHPEGRIRSFDLTFPQPFVEPPRVTLGFQPRPVGGFGIGWAVYAQKVTHTNYDGNLIGTEPTGRADTTAFATAPVRVDYVAIGKWRR